MTLGKLDKLYRVFFRRAHGKNRRHRAIPLSFLCREFIIAECLLTLGKLFAECAIKNTRQTTVCRQNNAVCCMPSVTLGKAFAACLGKASVSRSES